MTIIFIDITFFSMDNNFKLFVSLELGPGTLCQHKFEHSSSPFDLSIIEHNSKIFGHSDSINVIMVQILINTVKC